MNDHDAGYRVFVRTVVGMAGLICILAAMTYLFGVSIFGGSLSDLSNRQQLAFWLLVFGAIYCAGAFFSGRFTWIFGEPITVQRLFIVTLTIALALAFLLPLLHNPN